MKIKIYLPLFEGFYNTLLEPDETYEMESVNEQRTTPAEYDDFEWDYATYKKEVGEKACEYIEEVICDTGLACSIEYNGIWSPKEYNFQTDRVECTILLDFNNLKRRFYKFFDQEWATGKFKSRPGFMSFYSELEYLANWEEVPEWKNVHIEAMLECILFHGSDYDRGAYIDRCLAGVNLECLNYDELINQ